MSPSQESSNRPTTSFWLLVAVWCGVGGLSGCFFGSRPAHPELPPPPALSPEEMMHQGETVNRALAFDCARFALPPATVAVLTDTVAQDMGWKEHFILRDNKEESYIVVLSEGKTFGVRRRVLISPHESGSEVLVLPPDEGLVARIQERVVSYLTKHTNTDEQHCPCVTRIALPFAQVWRAVKQTVIDAGFSFKTIADDVGFIETEREPLGKARRSWFQGIGTVSLVAYTPALDYDYKSVEWHYRIRVIPIDGKTTQVSVEAVVEATPGSSTLATLKDIGSGAFDLLAIPFGPLVSGVVTDDSPTRLVLPSRATLEKSFVTGLEAQLHDKAPKHVQEQPGRADTPLSRTSM